MQRNRTFTESPVSPVSPEATVVPYTTPGASTKQLDFIASLMGERVVKAETLLVLEPKLDVQRGANEVMDRAPVAEGISSKQASNVIGKLMDLPKVAPANNGHSVAPKVPNGRYAIESSKIEPGDSGIRFYKVNSPAEGRWAGFTFVDAGAGGAHDDLVWHPIRNRAHKAQILTAIAQDPETALCLYGQTLGHCGDCGRTLTDEVSRAIGRGPVCRAKSAF